MAVQLKPKPTRLPVPLAPAVQADAGCQAQRYQLAELKLDATLPRPAGKPVAIGLTSPLIDIDLAKQPWPRRALNQAGGALIKGQLSGSQLLDGPPSKAASSWPRCRPHALFAELGLPVPNTRDATRPHADGRHQASSAGRTIPRGPVASC